jgi:hypothetical protein
MTSEGRHRWRTGSRILAAVAPIVGTARVAAATVNIARTLGFAIEVAELEEEAEADV